MKTKLILFDWGNIVESHTTGYTCYDAWNDLFHACGYEGNETVFNFLGKYKVSCIGSIEEFENAFELMAKEFGFNKTYKEFVELYKNIFDKIDYYQNVADYEVSLKDRSYIGILSDLTIFDKPRLDKQVCLANYDYVFLSFELGMKKTDDGLFNIVQSKLPFNPKDILFIDDRKDNIEAASKVGWNTLQATGLELDRIKEKCESFLK